MNVMRRHWDRVLLLLAVITGPCIPFMGGGL